MIILLYFFSSCATLALRTSWRDVLHSLRSALTSSHVDAAAAVLRIRRSVRGDFGGEEAFTGRAGTG